MVQFSAEVKWEVGNSFKSIINAFKHQKCLHFYVISDVPDVSDDANVLPCPSVKINLE